VLEIRAIDVYHGDLQALWGVSLAVKENEILAIIGSNGAGKTTILNTVAGLLTPAAGTMTFKDVLLNTVPAFQRVELGIALVPEGRGLFSGMTVLENLELGAFSTAARKRRAETFKLIYEMFPFLGERRKQRAGTMSGGEQQMLAIARGLMSRPTLLLFDEPSLGLAPLVTKSIFEAIGEINKSGTTVVLVEQNVGVSLRLANSAYIVENGRIVRHGEAKNFLEDERIKDAYFGTGSARGGVQN
jgi:branched-chain amino acid transport system ATP-binding protein